MLRDFELDAATLLEAAGVGSMSSSPPTLYAGGFPDDTPATLVSVRDTGGEEPDVYVGRGAPLFRPEVQVLVRAPVKDDARQLAVRCFEALFLARSDAYARIQPQGSGPVYQGPDANGRAVYTFNVRGEYAAAVVDGVVVPLPASGPLLVPSLAVEGDADVGGVLAVGARPFAGFPPAAEHPRGVLYDTDAGALRVSNGTEWVLAAGQGGAEASAVTVQPAGNLASTNLQAALEELQADVDSRATTMALTTHAGAATAHGVTSAVVGTSDAQTLSNKKFSDTITSTVASGGIWARARTGAKLVLDDNSTVYILWDTSVIDISHRVRIAGELEVGSPGTAAVKAYYRTLQLHCAASETSGAVAVAVGSSSGWSGATSRLLQVHNNFTEKLGVDVEGRLVWPITDTSATPGAATIHKPVGRVAIPAGAFSVTVTNKLVTSTSIVLQELETDDATLVRLKPVTKVAGSFTIQGNAAATGIVRVAFIVIS